MKTAEGVNILIFITLASKVKYVSEEVNNIAVPEKLVKLSFCSFLTKPFLSSVIQM